MSAAPPRPLPIGIGLRHAHHAELLAQRPALDFVEVHAENFFADGGTAPALLDEVRRHYAVSLHGVGLSLGSACGLDAAHLARLAALAQRVDPRLLSDHAAFARSPLRADGVPVHAADLLPIAFTPAALAILAGNVDRAQAALGRRLLVENLSAYIAWADDSLDEPAFLAELCRRTGCGLLLDLNNLVVNALNHGAADPAQWAADWVARLPPGVVGQIHLAGHSPALPGRCVVDDHGQPVGEAVWQVYADTLRHCGPVPTLIEWDTDLPALQTLLEQAGRALSIARQVLGDGRPQPQLRSADLDPPGGQHIEPALADREALRQQTLLQALFAPGGVERATDPEGLREAGQLGESPPRWSALPAAAARHAAPAPQAAALLPYRRNAAATAARALRAAYPTVAAMLGNEPFRAAAWALWLAHPPRSGDLADWGAELPSWLTQQAQLQAWPWLADSAQLDWAVHRCARAADATPYPQTLSLLGEYPADRLRLDLLPGTTARCSDWPIVSLHAAHRPAGAPADAPAAVDAPAQAHAGSSVPARQAPPALAAARQAIARRQGECACVVRSGWAVEVHPVSRATAAWMADLLTGLDLAQALQRAAARAADVGPLDFTAWLTDALRLGWIRCAALIDETAG